MHIFGYRGSAAPLATRAATRIEEVRPLLDAAEEAARGRWVVLFVAYDAAPAFDRAMRTAHTRTAPRAPVPLAWMAEFEHLEFETGQPVEGAPGPAFVPQLDAAAFSDRVRQAQSHIAAGDTYQVNLTFPLQADATGVDAAAWFAHLRRRQPAPYQAYLDIGSHAILSLSPELFFEHDGHVLRTRPMKGTGRRGRWLAEDEASGRSLASSRKTQAENVMIVDLLRNDIGRVSETGSVHVASLFTVERYPTLWQMTSTVEGMLRPGTSLTGIFDALFPCGSVTGAPKIRTMELIAELEGTPRGLYTGTIGLLQPGGRATFSVAIRTIVVDRGGSVATLGVGAGITADSVPEDEYSECLLKGAFASTRESTHAESFRLLETMRLEQGAVVRQERHFERMRASAAYFGFAWDEERTRATVNGAAAAHPEGVWRMRLLHDAAGALDVTCTPHDDSTHQPWRLAFANAPVDERDPFLCNKTTNRQVYDRARRGRPDVDDVLLWNSRRELTESTIANVVVEIDGGRYTPPLDCGLLAGTLRAELLERGEIRERVISRGEVMRAERIWLINSMRGWIEGVVVR